jgi:hypothetical protein
MALDLFFVGAAEVTAARHKDIEQAIPIEIKQGHPAAERFQDGAVIGFLAVVVGKVHPRSRRHVLEVIHPGSRSVGSILPPERKTEHAADQRDSKQ